MRSIRIRVCKGTHRGLCIPTTTHPCLDVAFSKHEECTHKTPSAPSKRSARECPLHHQEGLWKETIAKADSLPHYDISSQLINLIKPYTVFASVNIESLSAPGHFSDSHLKRLWKALIWLSCPLTINSPNLSTLPDRTHNVATAKPSPLSSLNASWLFCCNWNLAFPQDTASPVGAASFSLVDSHLLLPDHSFPASTLFYNLSL